MTSKLLFSPPTWGIAAAGQLIGVAPSSLELPNPQRLSPTEAMLVRIGSCLRGWGYHWPVPGPARVFGSSWWALNPVYVAPKFSELPRPTSIVEVYGASFEIEWPDGPVLSRDVSGNVEDPGIYTDPDDT